MFDVLTLPSEIFAICGADYGRDCFHNMDWISLNFFISQNKNLSPTQQKRFQKQNNSEKLF